MKDCKSAVVSFVDPDSGEVIFKSQKKVLMRCDESLGRYLDNVFSSFKRGLHQRNLSILIEVRDYENSLDLKFT